MTRSDNDRATMGITTEGLRITRAARQLAGYANFMRWAANFQKDELTRHPRHDRIMMLSPMQSGRFAFATIADTLYLGVQPFEAAWLAALPLDKAYVSDRLYLSVDGVSCMDGRLSALAFGIFVDDEQKRAQMAAASRLQLVRIDVENGHVSSAGAEIGSAIAAEPRDIVTALAIAAKARIKQQDTTRFF